MSKLSTAIKLIKKNKGDFFAALLQNICFLFPDKLYLQLLFRCKLGRKLDLVNPQTYNEKLQWLKLYNRNPTYTTLVDKGSVKNWVAERIGDEYIIPTLGTWNTVESIDFDVLPNQFVIKTTNGGGGDVVICKNKDAFDKIGALRRLRKGLKKNIYKKYREYPYKNIEPRIIAEKYLEDDDGELKDYKFFCFNGVVRCIQVDYDRFVEHHRNMYDVDWNLLPFTIMYPSNKDVVIKKPKNLEKMIEIAETLSEGIPHVRVDLYNIGGLIYFGELTFYHASGMKPFSPESWDLQFGNWLTLPKKEKC